jgi:hypothetical protein
LEKILNHLRFDFGTCFCPVMRNQSKKTQTAVTSTTKAERHPKVEKERAKLADQRKADQKEKNMNQVIDHQGNVAENGLKAQLSIKKKKAHDGEVKRSKEEIALLKVEMNEKNRELEVISDELNLQKIFYHKHIDDKRYKVATLKMAAEAIEGQGHRLISMADAEKIFDSISNGADYNQVNMHIKYLGDN